MWIGIVIAALLGILTGLWFYLSFRHRRFTRFTFQIGDTITILSTTGSQTCKIKGISRKVSTRAVEMILGDEEGD